MLVAGKRAGCCCCCACVCVDGKTPGGKKLATDEAGGCSGGGCIGATPAVEDVCGGLTGFIIDHAGASYCETGTDGS